MSDTKDGGPAFPTSTHQAGPYGGLSVRDYFAAAALTGALANADIVAQAVRDANQQGLSDAGGLLAEAAYVAADTMLSTRETQS